MKDAAVAHLKDDRKVVNFTVAVNDYYKPKRAEKGVSVTSYINCAYWINPTIAPQLTKSSLIEIRGRLSVNPYLFSTRRYKGDAELSHGFFQDTPAVQKGSTGRNSKRAGAG